jgi:hypothetical protein
MAQGKKISELTEVSSVTDNDEFLFVDKEGSGADSGVGGKTAKIKFSNLKASFGNLGEQGEKGEKGDAGPRGLDGAGTQYWTQSPTDGDAVYYDAGNIGIGTDSPIAPLQVVGNSSFTDPDGAGSSVIIGHPGIGSDTTSGQIRIYDSKDVLQMNLLAGGKYTFMNGNVGIGTDAPHSDFSLHIKPSLNAILAEGDVTIARQGPTSQPDLILRGIHENTSDLTTDYLAIKCISSSMTAGNPRPSSHIEMNDKNESTGATEYGPNMYMRLGATRSDDPDSRSTSDSLIQIQTSHPYVEGEKATRLRLTGAGKAYLGTLTKTATSTEFVSQLTLDDGNVGIGTSTPKNKLHVVSDSDNSVVAKFTHPFAEGATAEETSNYESYVSVQAGYKDDVWGEQSTVRIGAKRSATSNEASLVLQTVGAGRSTGDKLVDRMYIGNGYGHTYIYGEMNNDSLDLNIDGTTSLLNLVNREPVVDETSVNPVGITFKSAHSSDETKPITTRAAIYATREASPGTPSAVSGKLHFAVNNHGSQLSDAMVIAPSGSVYFENSIVVRRSFADNPSAATNSAILNVVDSTIPDAHKSEFIVLGNGNIEQGGPQQIFNKNGASNNNTATSCMWSQRLNVPATTTAGTGGYTHYTFNIGNYVYGKFTIMANRTNTNANYAFAEYIVSNNSGILHSTALNEKLSGGNVEIQITTLNNNQTGLSSNQCQLKIAMNQTTSGGSITVFYHGSGSLASTDHDDSHTNW